METVDLKLPSELLRVANLEESNFSQEVARLLALELYREDKISLGRAAELCQTPLAAFMDFAAKHGVPPLRYSFEDLEKELHTADRLKAWKPDSSESESVDDKSGNGAGQGASKDNGKRKSGPQKRRA
jgi:predicted HTH domain antitoxin